MADDINIIEAIVAINPDAQATVSDNDYDKITWTTGTTPISKADLQTKVAELQTEYDEIKPTTPTGTTDWYVKWISMLLAVVGIFLISASLTFYGQIAYIVSCLGWIYVGMQWGDRAIMIGSAVSCTAIAMNLVNTFT